MGVGEGKRSNLARFAPFEIHSLVVIRSHFPVGRQVKKIRVLHKEEIGDGFVVGANSVCCRVK